MLFRVLCLFCISSFIATGVQGAGDSNEGAEISPAVDYSDTLGVGTEGYGSPVKSGSISSGELYSSRSGYLHPFLSVGGFYTDNLFNTQNQEKSDWVAVITPGIWVARPASRQKMVDINTINTAPGGLALSRFKTESDRRLQTYALYRADIREHNKYSDENRVDHRAEGMVRLSLRGGLSMELADVYEVNHDPYGTGGTPERTLDKYTSNYASASLDYKLTSKFSVRLDYSNYYLDYDKQRNEYRNRDDNSVSAYVYYKATPKTTFFTQVEHIMVDYDKDINSDHDETNYYLGMRMQTSAKTRGRIKIGYSTNDYDQSGLKNRDEWVMEGQADYFFTPKTSIYLRGLRRVYETDTRGAQDILTHRVQLGYRQRFTAKLRGEAATYYIDNDYDGKVTIDGVTGSRDDKIWGFVAAIGFSPKSWLNLSLGYDFVDRNSNFDSQDYSTNKIFLRATAAL